MIDRTSPLWVRLRANCCDFSPLDMDEQADSVFRLVSKVAAGDVVSPSYAESPAAAHTRRQK